MVDLGTAPLHELHDQVQQDVTDVLIALTEAGTVTTVTKEVFIELLDLVTSASRNASKPREYLMPCNKHKNVQAGRQR